MYYARAWYLELTLDACVREYLHSRLLFLGAAICIIAYLFRSCGHQREKRLELYSVRLQCAIAGAISGNQHWSRYGYGGDLGA